MSYKPQATATNDPDYIVTNAWRFGTKEEADGAAMLLVPPTTILKYWSEVSDASVTHRFANNMVNLINAH